jgi:hypothetical protein
MRRTLRFQTCDNASLLHEEHVLAYGLHAGHERGATELAVPAGTRVRMELLDDGDHLLDWRTYTVSAESTLDRIRV